VSRPWAVCVYCASGPGDPELLALADAVGRAIAERGWSVISGGGSVSAMGALADGARARGGHTVGVIPKALLHREVADVHADELLVTDTMRQRKQIMEDRADAFLAKEPLPDAVSEARELRGRLRRALGKLAPRPAEVFVLRAVEGLTNREVARLLGSSPATVAVQYFRARTQLRKELLAEGGGPS